MIPPYGPTKILLLALLLWSYAAVGGGVRGTVRSSEGPLSYASIYVEETGNGAATDQSGRFEIVLSPGTYRLRFQYLGYESKTVSVTVSGDNWQELQVLLKSQSVQLQTITIRANREDPAYAVMRRAIARARYHQVQVDSFSAIVYIKGKGKLKDYPWLAKKTLEKQGITKDRLFIQESASEIRYRRPNIFKEKVIAIYTQGKNNTSGPNEYVFGSLYDPELAETISPLSPKAFSYYRFEYLGIFRDQDAEVNKIRVIPRSKGDNVFDGTINIVEDEWSIHSVDLNTSRLGVKVNMKSVYHPIPSGSGRAWMPVNQQFRFEGSVFGFDFEGQYLATVKDYRIFLNPAMKHDIVISDSKVKEEAPKSKPAAPVRGKAQRNEQTRERLETGQEVSDQDLARLMKAMERAEAREQGNTTVVSDRTFRVDSTARKKDSLFWAGLRPAPLETEEIRGYVKADSMAEVEKKREEGDSARQSKHKGFQLFDLLIGDRYDLGNRTSLTIRTPYTGFNTVEGFHGIYRLSFTKRWVERDSLDPDAPPKVRRLEISPMLRYSWGRARFNPMISTSWVTPKSRILFDAGRYVRQLNPDDPINPSIQTALALYFGENFMKLMERDFVDLQWRYRATERFTWIWKASWSDRSPLENTTDYTFFDAFRGRYTSNVPVNIETADASFLRHQAVVMSMGMEARPGQKYRIRNGRKIRVDGAPLLSLTYTKGISGSLGSDVDYDLIEAGIRQGVRLGIRGRLDYRIQAGRFFNSARLYFPDYRHFNGNRTWLITSDPVTSFRLLDYYRFSTADAYLSAVANYHFRKLFVSRIPKLQLLGVKENVFGSCLYTPAMGWYAEAGFGLDGILRIFRVEFATSVTDAMRVPLGDQPKSGFRIGVIGNLGY